MLLALIYSNFASQLQKLNINTATDFNNSNWDDIKLFLENNSSRIIKTLKDFPSKIIIKNENSTKILEYIYKNRMQYKGKQNQDLIKDYIIASSDVYEHRIQKEYNNNGVK